MRWKGRLAASAAIAALAFAGCATVEAVRSTPPEVWEGIEKLIIALAEDIWSILDWIL